MASISYGMNLLIVNDIDLVHKTQCYSVGLQFLEITVSLASSDLVILFRISSFSDCYGPFSKFSN